MFLLAACFVYLVTQIVLVAMERGPNIIRLTFFGKPFFLEILASVTLLLVTVTFLQATICFRYFGKGLKEHCTIIVLTIVKKYKYANARRNSLVPPKVVEKQTEDMKRWDIE